MASFNKVILMGNLTRDPETRFAASGTAVINFGLAVNERFQGSDGQWQDRPTFIDVTMFGKRGEAFAKFHTKGKPAFIEGKLRLDTWEDKNGGGKRSKLYVVGDSWEFVGGGREGAGGGGSGGGAWSAGPAQGNPGANSPGNANSGDAWGGSPAFEDELSDTPF
jgi:single-strand DNA-binding protein